MRPSRPRSDKPHVGRKTANPHVRVEGEGHAVGNGGTPQSAVRKLGGHDLIAYLIAGRKLRGGRRELVSEQDTSGAVCRRFGRGPGGAWAWSLGRPFGWFLGSGLGRIPSWLLSRFPGWGPCWLLSRFPGRGPCWFPGRARATARRIARARAAGGSRSARHTDQRASLPRLLRDPTATLELALLEVCPLPVVVAVGAGRRRRRRGGPLRRRLAPGSELGPAAVRAISSPVPADCFGHPLAPRVIPSAPAVALVRAAAGKRLTPPTVGILILNRKACRPVGVSAAAVVAGAGATRRRTHHCAVQQAAGCNRRHEHQSQAHGEVGACGGMRPHLCRGLCRETYVSAGLSQTPSDSSMKEPKYTPKAASSDSSGTSSCTASA